MAYKNICIIGLSQNLINDLSKQLADKLEMFYANINDLLTYEIIDIDRAKKINGVEYVNMLLSKKIKTIASYENTVINASLSSLMQDNNYEILKNAVKIIYLHQPKDYYLETMVTDTDDKNLQKINQVVYEERHAICKKIADITYDLYDNDNNVIDTNLVINNLTKLVESY